MALLQYRPQWSIPGAGASESVMHFEADIGDATPIADAVGDFFLALASELPNDVTITFPNEMFVLDEATGTLVLVETVNAPPSVSGTQAGVWAGGVGAVIRWETGEIQDGRRVRGRTFIVPTTGAAFDLDGTLTTARIAAITADATAFLAALTAITASLVVYSRPRVATETLPARVGNAFAVSSAFVPDRTAILRERRDP